MRFGQAMLVLCAGLWCCEAQAQLLQPVSDAREIYAYGVLNSTRQLELRDQPASPFAPFSSRLEVNLFSARGDSSVNAQARQVSRVGLDSIYVHAYARTDACCAIDSMDTTARSEATIVFRVDVPPGQGVKYDLIFEAWGSCWGADVGAAIVNASLTGPGPGGGVQDTLQMQVGPGYSDRTAIELKEGILRSGEYTLRASCMAEHGQGSRSVELYVKIALLCTVDVARDSWSRIKTLYR
jgi:hypothetical protein